VLFPVLLAIVTAAAADKVVEGELDAERLHSSQIIYVGREHVRVVCLQFSLESCFHISHRLSRSPIVLDSYKRAFKRMASCLKSFIGFP